MGGFSLWHWILVLLFSLAWLVPLWRIVRKAGYPGALALLGLVPGVNAVMFWVFAFVRWPVEERVR